MRMRPHVAPTRAILEAVLWSLNTGAQWHRLPQGYPNYKTVHRRFPQWCAREILRKFSPRWQIPCAKKARSTTARASSMRRVLWPRVAARASGPSAVSIKGVRPLLSDPRVVCAAPLAGSLVALLVAWGMGAAEPAIRAGAFGFNSVLVAIAFGGVFFALNKVSIAYALLATITTPLIFAAVSAALEPLGVPA